MPIPLVQGEHLDICALDATAKFRVVIAQADDDMAIALGRQVVDQVHQPVFQTAIVEAVNDMRDQRRGFAQGCCSPPARISVAAMPACMAAMKRCSTACASSGCWS